MTGADLRIRTIIDAELPLYISLRSNRLSEEDTLMVEDEVRTILPPGWLFHKNAHNIAMIPPFIGKGKATKWLLENGDLVESSYILGFGDSHSDRVYMDLCDFAMMPTNSQLYNILTEATSFSDSSQMNQPTFSGSYDPNDVIFLLKCIDIAPTTVEEKEAAIQSGERHYSEMVGVEKPPNKEYLDLFYQAYKLNVDRFASNLASLVKKLNNEYQVKPLVLVSLARGGTPVGVLLKKRLIRVGD